MYLSSFVPVLSLATVVFLNMANSLPTTPKRCEISAASEIFTQSSTGSNFMKSETHGRSEESKVESRCFQTLLGWFTESQVAGTLEDYAGAGQYDIPEYSNMQGGVQSGQLGNSGSYGAPSHIPPGIPNHAIDAVQNAHLMNSQLQGLSGQFSGIQGSSIPLSPTHLGQNEFRQVVISY